MIKTDAPTSRAALRPRSSEETESLSVTDIAAYVGLRQCARYLKLSLRSTSNARGAPGGCSSHSNNNDIDAALAAAGHQLEDDVATELRQRAPHAPHHPVRNPAGDAVRNQDLIAKQPSTPWLKFLDLLAQAQESGSSAEARVACWAAEVVLQGRPTPDCTVSLHGRADFILLLWRGGAPVLRIVECKASSEPQTKFIVQLVLYRMMLLELLSASSAVAASNSDDRAQVRLGGTQWKLPSRVGSRSADPLELQVECLLRTGVSGAAGHPVDGKALPTWEVDAMTRQLTDMLQSGGSIAVALDSRVPLEAVPYELDSHCAGCSRAAPCWADTAARGAVQLSGCSASEAQQLATAGVRDIEDLAALLLPPPLPPGTTPSLRAAAAAARANWCAKKTGILPMDLQRLALTATVRAQRRIGARDEQRGVRQLQDRPPPPPPPPFRLLPSAPPSCLPGAAVRESLVRVYLSVAVDVVLRRVVGVAAHVAAHATNGTDTKRGVGDRRQPGGGGDVWEPLPPQTQQVGWDVVELLEGVELDGTGAVVSTKAQLDELEAQLLGHFSEQLCSAIERCAQAQQRQQQEAQAAAEQLMELRLQGGQRPQGQERQQQQQQADSEPLLLHFYMHSRHELRELIRRCNALDDDPHSGDGGRGPAAGRVTQSQAGSAGGIGNNGSFGGSSGAAAVRSAEPNAAAAAGLRRDLPAVAAGGFSWLPHLLGLRGEMGLLLGQADPDAAVSAMAGLEQAMVSLLEEEVARYATPWHGAGLLAATSVPWAGNGNTYDWRAPAPSPPAAAASGIGSDGGGDGVDLRATFAPHGYLNCLEPYRANVHRRMDAGDSREAQVASPLPEYVQVRPDMPSKSIPPALIRALWSSAAQNQIQIPGGNGDQRQQQGGRLQGQDDGRAARGPAAAQLRALLLAQAHSGRWLEERLVRLLPGGANPFLRKAPLDLRRPLAVSLRSFRVDTAAPVTGSPPRRAPQLVPQGPQGQRAVALARAALDAVWLDRAVGLQAFWRSLGVDSPADRAEEERRGSVVLDNLQRVPTGKGSFVYLRGRVVAPQGCCSLDDLTRMTGLKEGACVIVTKVEGDDPGVAQDAAVAMGRYALGGVQQVKVVASAQQQAAPTTTTVEVAVGFPQQRFPKNGMFPGGTPTCYPWSFAPPAATRVVLDELPSASGWVASSVVDCLVKYGGSSAYLGERLWLSLKPSAIDDPNEEPRQGPTGPVQEQRSPRTGAAGEPGRIAAAVEEGEPRTPASKGRGPGSDDGAGAGVSTPASLMRGQQLLSPPESPATPDQLQSGAGAGPPGAAAVRPQPSPGVATGEGGMQPSPHHLDRVELRWLTRRQGGQLDGDQVECVQAFLEHPAEGPRVLLQGPPGTGKTETVAAALLTWLAARIRDGGPMGPPGLGGVALVSGPTHTAINNLMARIAARLQDDSGDRAAPAVARQLRDRVRLVRLDSDKGPPNSELSQRGVELKLPARWQQDVWYVVGGTLRHLVKDAVTMRAGVYASAGQQGCELMRSSGDGAFATALVLDEASMLFAPQLLALGCLLLTRGSLLVAGDHRQLSTIYSHDFASEQRPNLVRHRPCVSAYEYVRLLAVEEARQERWRRQEVDLEPRAARGGTSSDGASPPPVVLRSLSYSHRLPSAIRTLIQPLYSSDGITLRGRPPGPVPAPPPRTPPAPAPTRGSLASVIGIAGRSGLAAAASTVGRSIAVAFAAASRPAAHSTVSVARPATPQPQPQPDGPTGFPVPATGSGGGAAAADVWQLLWGQGGASGGDEGSEGVFLLTHNEDRSSRVNLVELEIVEAILSVRPGAGSVALITPHRAQRRALLQLVEARGWSNGCRVDTVERMQGDEADTVIFSATASDPSVLERSEQFYASASRANVAFSRAQRRLIVIAGRTFLQHLPTSYSRYEGLVLWRQLRRMCPESESFVGTAHLRVGAGLQGTEAAAAVAVATTGLAVAATGAGAGLAAAAGTAAAVAAVAAGPADAFEAGGELAVTYRCDVFRAME